jgi:hypothetical protein
MQFTMRVEVEGVAFDDPGDELARLLREAADEIDGGDESGVCVDINGNTRGGWEITG